MMLFDTHAHLHFPDFAEDLDAGKLESMTTVVALGDVVGVANDILAGRVRGRVVVDVRA